MARRSTREARKLDRRVVRRAAAVIRRTGLAGRIDDVRTKVSSPFFRQNLLVRIARHEGRAGRLTDYEILRGLAMETLRASFPGVDVAGVQLVFAWDPAKQELGIQVQGTPEAAMSAIAEARGAA